MKPGDKDKLDECLSILDSTDLGLSLVWLWTWSTINNILDDPEWKATVSKDDMWLYLCDAVSNGSGFSLEYGAEQHQEEVLEWMANRGYISDPWLDEEDEEDEEE